MDESSSNLLRYGFSSLDEEIAKDQRESEFASGSAVLDSSSNQDGATNQDGVLQNVNPSVILDITGARDNARERKKQEHINAADPGTTTDVQSCQQTEEPIKAKPVVRARKRKSAKVKDENAPKLPQTGYVMYMNKRRDDIKAKEPHITFTQLTRTIASEWSAMDPVDKKKYLDMAEVKKAKYAEELNLYKQTEAFKNFQSKKQSESASASKPAPGPAKDSVQVKQSTVPPPRMPGMDIPIFTEQFLEHNKNREKELRELRTLNYQYEEQNAILSKHVEELKGIVSSLEEESNTQRNNNIALIQHLESLRDTLATNFVSIPLPGSDEVPTVATIDSYMTKLHKIILDSPQENQDLIVAVREVVNKLNLEAYVT